MVCWPGRRSSLMSAFGRILGGMGELAVIPAWVAPAHRSVVDMNHMAYALAHQVDSVHAAGQLAAVGWVTGVRDAPVTERADSASWEMVRAESWVALCHAAQAPPPRERDWERLGVAARPVVAGGADFAHGAWRTMAWLLGVHAQPPTELPERAEDGSVPPWERRYAMAPQPRSPKWRAMEARRLERNHAEALRHWRHIRDRADSTG